MIFNLREVVLRPVEPRDVDALYEFRNDGDVTKHLVGFSEGFSRENLSAWILAHENNQREALWAIAEKESDRCVGHVALYDIDQHAGSAEFGIVLARRCWGKGFGRKATVTVIDWGLRQLNLHRICLNVLATNARAIHLYESMGFRQEGRLREAGFRDGRYEDVLVMGILQDEWLQQTNQAVVVAP